MKLYTINCYGLNYGMGVTEHDAIQSYLFRHPELQEVDGIEDNLKAKLLLNDAQFEDIFADLVGINNETGLSTYMILCIKDKADGFGLKLSVEETVGIYEVFESMLDEVSIYSSYSMSIEEIIRCKQTIKEIETDFYETNFKPVDKDKYRIVDDISILKFIGFYDTDDALRCDITDGAEYIYDEEDGTITEYINGQEHRTFSKVGEFIDSEVLGRE